MAWQRVKLSIPKRFGPLERQAIAQEVIDFIINRTKSGKNINGKSFPGYTKEYKVFKGSSNVDLTLSEEMLNAISLLNHKSGEILIGFDKSDKELNGKAEGNQLGTYGQPTPIKGKARPFLGIKGEDLKNILDQFPVQKSEARDKATDDLTAALAADALVDGIDFELPE